MTKMVPRKRSAEVTITLKDGTSYVAMADHPKGEPEFHMTVEDYIVKFHELAAMGGKNQEERDAIIDMAINFNGPVRELMAKLQ
jgi:2-methylcitrate dehydratase PrpD